MNTRRPLGVAVIAIFLVANAAVTVGQLVIDSSLATRIQTLNEIHGLAPAFIVVLSAISVLAAAGLWFGRRWAWALAMLVVGVSLVVSLYLYWVGDPPYPRMAIDVVLAFYLNQGALRDYFERGGRASGKVGPSA